VFGDPNNKRESNYRQVERIKQRCIQAGIEVGFNEYLSSFYTEHGAKIKFLDIAEEALSKLPDPKDKPNTLSRFTARKVDWGI